MRDTLLLILGLAVIYALFGEGDKNLRKASDRFGRWLDSDITTTTVNQPVDTGVRGD